MADIEKDYQDFLETVKKTYNSDDVAVIEKAYLLAQKQHVEQFRLSGEPYIMHPLAVAQIVVGLGMDAPSVIAALLHDTVEDTPITTDEIKDLFGEDVALLVDGVTKLGKVPLSTREEAQAENLRKMLLAMSQDIRVIIIKLADRLHNMRTLQYMRPQKQRDKAHETLDIYAPLAHRLGIRAMKEQLEDLSLYFLDPIGYKEIEEDLENQNKTRLQFLEETKERIAERLSDVVDNVHISGRVKSVNSIYRKMFMQGKSFDEIYDVYALRIIVDSVADCYNILGIIHDMFRPIPGRFKDYISTPKPNMYQSLHTTVIGTEGIPFEVQIRTWEMHHTAEYGIAAHWKYKLGISGKDNLEERLAWVRQLLENQKDSESVEEIVQTIKSDFVPEEVFAFTPKGDVINLPLGSTVIDFAYAIHSAVGNRLTGAKVDGRIVPIDYQMKNGEIIEILTSSNPNKGPSRDWLKIVRTGSARAKIRQWFKKERRDENIEQGKEDVERELRRNFIRLDDEEVTELLMKIAERHHFQSIDDFYAAVGYGGISILKLMPRIKEEYAKIHPPKAPVVEEVKQTHIPKSSKSSGGGVVVEGIDNCLIKISQCCNPLPGDDIIGFITRGHGVSVHKRNCKNVPVDLSQSEEPERWIRAYWDKDIKSEFKASLIVNCLNRVGMLADVSAAVAAVGVSIHDIGIQNTKDGRTAINLTVTVNGMEHLKSVLERLRKINGVLLVERI